MVDSSLNRCTPSYRDLCGLWLMYWRRDLDLRIESHKTWYRDRVLDEQAMRREGQYA